MAANRLSVYEIPFTDRETFERVWPAILKVKSKGSRLCLLRLEHETPPFLSSAEPVVRIYAPLNGWLPPAGSRSWPVPDSPPRPEEVLSDMAPLPEYVRTKEVGGKTVWVPSEGNRGYRARIEIALVVDGEIIDLNRIPLPPDTPIVDRRFEKRSESTEAE
jgi:hypothetical protein